MSDIPVGVVIPVFNGQQFLRASLESAIGQTYKNLYVIAVDDHSVDGSSEILSQYAERFENFIFLAATQRGPSRARNLGIDAAPVEFIAVLDQDDVFVPHKVESLMSHAIGKGLDVVTSAAEIIDGSGSSRGTLEYPTEHDDVSEQLKRWCCICHSSAVYRKESVLAVGGYRSAFMTAHDYDLWLRLAEGGAIFGGVREPLVHHRVHAESHGASSGRRGLWEKTHVLLSRALRLSAMKDVFESDREESELNWDAVKSIIAESELASYSRLREAGLDDESYRELIGGLNQLLSAEISSLEGTTSHP